MKIERSIKIFHRIGLRLSENACADQIEYHLSYITRRLHAPVFKDRHDHRPELLQCELPDSFQQFAGVDVRTRLGLSSFPLFDREFEGFLEKDVRFFCVPWILSDDLIDNFVKRSLHFLTWTQPAVAGRLFPERV